LFIAPKIKYCITVDEHGRIAEKKTFKGYTKSKVKVEDFLDEKYSSQDKPLFH